MSHRCRARLSRGRGANLGGRTCIEVSLGHQLTRYHRVPTLHMNPNPGFRGSGYRLPTATVPPRGRRTRYNPSPGSSVHISESAYRSDSDFKTHEYQSTSRPLPDYGIVRVRFPKTQAHLWSSDRYVESGVANHWVIDNRNKCLWVFLPIRGAENVQT